MELRDIDVNEAAEPVESSTTETEKVVEPVVTPKEEPKLAEEPAQAPTEVPVKGQEENQEPEPRVIEKPKSSRAEERIRNLAYENKILKDKVEAFAHQKAPELQKDEVNYDDLNKIINERAIQAAELLSAGKQVETEYHGQAIKWADDLDQVRKDNPQLNPESPEYDVEFDTTLARLLDDGTGMPRTDVLVSDILKTFKKREQAAQIKAKAEGKAESNARLAKQMSEGAITPTAKSPSTSEEYTDEELEALRTSSPKEYMKIIDRI